MSSQSFLYRVPSTEYKARSECRLCPVLGTWYSVLGTLCELLARPEDCVKRVGVARAGGERCPHQARGVLGQAGDVAVLVQQRRQEIHPASRRTLGQRHAARVLLILTWRLV